MWTFPLRPHRLNKQIPLNHISSFEFLIGLIVFLSAFLSSIINIQQWKKKRRSARQLNKLKQLWHQHNILPFDIRPASQLAASNAITHKYSMWFESVGISGHYEHWIGAGMRPFLILNSAIVLVARNRNHVVFVVFGLCVPPRFIFNLRIH